MKDINIMVMGRRRVGKSTLINSVFGEEVASVGEHREVSETNALYSKKIFLNVDEKTKEECRVNMFDIVGLGIDDELTRNTLEEVKNTINCAKRFLMSENSYYMVWFCVDNRNEQWETCELELLKILALEYKIPFVITFMMNFSEKEGVLEKQIREKLCWIPTQRVLTERNGSGEKILSKADIESLLKFCICKYQDLVAAVMQNTFDKEIETFIENQNRDIWHIKGLGSGIIMKYSMAAGKIGWVPVGCIPIVHGICIKMINDLNKLVGVSVGKEFTEEIVASIVVGVITTPFMAVPLLSALVARVYVEQIGDDYLELLIKAVTTSTDEIMRDKKELAQRIKTALENKFKIE